MLQLAALKTIVMAKKELYTTQFDPDCIYHVYNQTVDRKPMFKSITDYAFFKDRIETYLRDVADIYTFVLLPNAFDLLIRIKADQTHNSVGNKLRRMLQSYAVWFNRRNNRVGSPFQHPFRRIEVTKEMDFLRLVREIHTKPQLLSFTDNFRDLALLDISNDSNR